MVSICFVLFLGDMLVRIFFPYTKDHVMPAGMFEIDPHLGWKLNSRKKGIHHSRHFNVHYSINSMGYRDKPRKA